MEKDLNVNSIFAEFVTFLYPASETFTSAHLSFKFMFECTSFKLDFIWQMLTFLCSISVIIFHIISCHSWNPRCKFQSESIKKLNYLQKHYICAALWKLFRGDLKVPLFFDMNFSKTQKFDSSCENDIEENYEDILRLFSTYGKKYESFILLNLMRKAMLSSRYRPKYKIQGIINKINKFKC